MKTPHRNPSELSIMRLANSSFLHSEWPQWNSSSHSKCFLGQPLTFYSHKSKRLSLLNFAVTTLHIGVPDYTTILKVAQFNQKISHPKFFSLLEYHWKSSQIWPKKGPKIPLTFFPHSSGTSVTGKVA